MDGYLFAECVIDKLVSHNIIKGKPMWKRTNPQTKNYGVMFYGAKHPSLIIFQVVIIENNHYITKTSFINQSCYFSIAPPLVESITSDCLIHKMTQ